MTTKATKAERVGRLVDLLGLWPQCRAVQLAADEWKISGAQVHKNYMTPAREAIAEMVGMTRTAMIKQQHRRLNAIYNRSDDDKIKLQACKQLADLYGLDAPSQVAMTVDVLYNPEEQLRALSDPRMLKKVLALDADFEQMRLGHADRDGDATDVPDGQGADAGQAGLPGDSRLHVPGASPATPKGANGAAPTE